MFLICEKKLVFLILSNSLSQERENQAWPMLVFIITITVRTPEQAAESATTFPEILVAVLLFVGFCGSIFELNAVCLRYIDASKESVSALESINDRCETL